MNNALDEFGKNGDEYNEGASANKLTSDALDFYTDRPIEPTCEKELYAAMEKLQLPKQYTIHGSSYYAAGNTVKKLDPGTYNIGINDAGVYYTKIEIQSDEWLTFRDSLINQVEKEIETFWSQEKVFKQYKVLHRRGMILYGPPGTGKTVLIKQIIDRIVKNGGIVFICDYRPDIVSKGLKVFRDIEPARKVVCVFEDIDTIIRQYGEEDMLNLLDGENVIDHVLNIATTNYPERLDRRIVGRPRRFDRLVKIGYPDASMREFYFKHKLGIKDAELSKWAVATEGFTFAALAELLISVKCLNNDFNESVERIKELISSTASSEDFKPSVGFASKKVGF
jgi:hypothetical protein